MNAIQACVTDDYDAPEVEIVDADTTECERPVESPPDDSEVALLALVESILKRRDRLERLIRQPSLQSQLVPKFLAISLVGFLFFGAALSLVFTAAGQWPQPTAIPDLVTGQATNVMSWATMATGESRLGRWLDGSAPTLVAAYAIGLITATCICLPSLYFYGLLAGARMTMLDVVIHALKAKAVSAVALVGILPIYAALGLGIVVFEVPELVRHATFWLGLILPFLAGLFGTYSLYHGFLGLADTLPPDRRCRRACFLRRLVFSWGACYTAVTPVMIHTLWVLFAR